MQSKWTKRAHNETRALNNKNPFFFISICAIANHPASNNHHHHRKLLLKPLFDWVIWFAFFKRKSTALYLFFHSKTDRCFPISKFRVLDLGKIKDTLNRFVTFVNITIIWMTVIKSHTFLWIRFCAVIRRVAFRSERMLNDKLRFSAWDRLEWCE